jgi:TolB-like protein
LHETPEPVSQLRPDASADFEHVIAKALTKDANKRYASATELLQDLENLKAGKPLKSAPVAVPVATTVITEKTIAVLEFTNISGNPADDWLAGGMAETLTVDLKKISALKVISRETVATTLARFAQQKPSEERNLVLGRELKARWIIWGGYQKLGLTIRITAHFADVATGSLIGAAKVDGMMEDIFKLQDQLITSLLETLNLAVTSAELQKIERPETFELKAYEYYARGRQMWIQFSPDSFRESQKFFEKAIAIDPNYALAYSSLGSAHITQFISQTGPQDLELGITYLQKALQHDPDLAEPYT